LESRERILFHCGLKPFFAINALRLMELTYKVKGADGKDYGPVSHERLLAWMREGRVSGNTEVMRSDVNYWAAASQYSELQAEPPVMAGAASANAPGSNPAGAASVNQAAGASLKADAGWFYWIAGISLFNSISYFGGWGFYLAFGLGITRLLDHSGVAGNNSVIALALDVAIVAVFALFGFFANKRHLWAFVAGTVLFAVDCLVFVRAQLWLGVAFHAIALYFMGRGTKTCWQLNRG
jgi:hypothetical protein